MTSPTPSPLSQPCSPPEQESWRRSELLAAAEQLNDVVGVLRRVQRVEYRRGTGALAHVVGDLAEDALTSCHALIRSVDNSGRLDPR